MSEKQDTRDTILDAAMKRFLHYGYAKTTMSEIATDCDMSAGNIYRFFPSKLDIAEAMARRFQATINQEFAAIARDGNRLASERLKAIFNYEMERIFSQIQDNINVVAVVRIMTDERPQFMEEGFAQQRMHISAILKDGSKSGEFVEMADPLRTAEAIQFAMTSFTSPEMMRESSFEVLQRNLDTTLELLLNGLYNR